MSKCIIKQKYIIKAPIDSVWQAFVDPKTIAKWGGGPAKMDAVEGTEFSLWGGDIYGTNTKVIKHKLLEQDWFSGKWDRPSQASFRFAAKDDWTELKLVHKNIPDAAAKEIEQGWKDYYLGPIKELLEK